MNNKGICAERLEKIADSARDAAGKPDTAQDRLVSIVRNDVPDLVKEVRRLRRELRKRVRAGGSGRLPNIPNPGRNDLTRRINTIMDDAIIDLYETGIGPDGIYLCVLDLAVSMKIGTEAYDAARPELVDRGLSKTVTAAVHSFIPFAIEKALSGELPRVRADV